MGIIHDFNNTLSLWINENITPNIEVFEGEDFCYYYEEHIVQWGLIARENTDNNFLQFLHEYGLDYDAVSPFVMSFLHEIGHAVTLSNFSDEMQAEERYAKNSMIVSKSNIDVNYWYWELPTEFAANMWAIEWANNNIEKFTELHALCKQYLTMIGNDENVIEQVQEWMDNAASGEDCAPLYIYEEDCDKE